MKVLAALFVFIFLVGLAWDHERQTEHIVRIEKRLERMEDKLDTLLIEDYHYRIEKGSRAEDRPNLAARGERSE